MTKAKNLKSILLAFILVFGVLTFYSCEQESLSEMKDEQENAGDAKSFLKLKSNKNEEGQDIDEFKFKYPVQIIFDDESTITVNNEEEEYSAYDKWFAENENSDSYPTYVFPITVILKDDQEKIVNSEDELFDLYVECGGDLDWESFEFIYPITIVFPDGSTQDVNSDEEMDKLFDEWDEKNPESEKYPTFQFPIKVKLEDGTEKTINSEEELDELMGDDDFGFDDFDCEIAEDFEYVYPVKVVFPDGTTQVVNNDDEMDKLFEDWEEKNFESEEYPTFEFPIKVKLEDGSEETINNEEELDELYGYGDFNFDDFEDIIEEFEDVEVIYPVTVVFPDGSTQDVNSDDEIEKLFEEWDSKNMDSEEFPTFKFPIEVKIDNTTETINNEEELEDLFWDYMESEEDYGDDYEDM